MEACTQTSDTVCAEVQKPGESEPQAVGGSTEFVAEMPPSQATASDAARPIQGNATQDSPELEAAPEVPAGSVVADVPAQPETTEVDQPQQDTLRSDASAAGNAEQKEDVPSDPVVTELAKGATLQDNSATVNATRTEDAATESVIAELPKDATVQNSDAPRTEDVAPGSVVNGLPEDAKLNDSSANDTATRMDAVPSGSVLAPPSDDSPIPSVEDSVPVESSEANLTQHRPATGDVLKSTSDNDSDPAVFRADVSIMSDTAGTAESQTTVASVNCDECPGGSFLAEQCDEVDGKDRVCSPCSDACGENVTECKKTGPGPESVLCKECGPEMGSYLVNTDDDGYGECRPCSTCQKNSFLAEPCSESADAVCQQCSVCVEGEVEVSACNATQDTVCAPVATTDCSDCPNGEFLSKECDQEAGEDRQCRPCSDRCGEGVMDCIPTGDGDAHCPYCNFGPKIYSEDRDGDGYGECKFCSPCKAWQYLAEGCTSHTDNICRACT